MLAFAEKEWELNQVIDKASLREHLNDVWRQTGEKPVELEQQSCPEIFLSLWEQFRSLESGRQFCDAGLLPLSWSDIMAWSQLMRVKFSTLELNVIKRLDFISIKRKEK